ncbi:MarR family winged helix-turn-helix transcriptional regulator [Asticcacaulis machinosus]|uniref:MarR family transcriptional regulator n=1 Tax=Asticcacaulis machinosus TaxID=2984211 RepID=A0ABT5HN95_9CAUL|nr:MarR family transcriptional regulator [Asticcacaulis machinosus]MDC7677714.1 MarR family transcriptional regulator [Asticcacaulis machinosus]
MRLGLPAYNNYLPHYLERLAALVSDIAAPAYEARDLSSTEWRILALLSTHERLPQKDVSPGIGVEKVVAWRAITALRKKRYISREFCEGDYRAYDLFLTEAGRLKYEETVPSALHRAASLMPELSYDELTQLLGLLKRLGGPDTGNADAVNDFRASERATAA